MISSDEWLIRKIKRGDDFAINEFVEKYYPIILNYCKKRVRDWGMAEDLTQETFVHFFRSLSLYRHHGKTQNYLYTIAGNLCRDFYKTNKEEIPMEETDLTGIRLSGMAQNGKLSYDPLEDAAERMDMQMALDKLPDIYREIMKLHIQMTNGVYGLLGLNGAGKTTLMRMICTLVKPDSGSILCNGKEIQKMDKEYRRLLGYLPQDFGFYPDFTAEEYLLYIASIKDLPFALAQKRVQELLHYVGMEKHRKRKMKRLSGGMKRRIGIAQAMLNNPQILILDEPTAGLDPNERIRFRNLLSELSRDRLVLLSTHIVSDIEYIANEILLMRDGKTTDSGTAAQLIEAMPMQVYLCTVPEDQAGEYFRKYRIANAKTTMEGTELRILAPHSPAPDARMTQTTLEDVFLYHFGEGGKNNVF